jgi:hypothetical protein
MKIWWEGLGVAYVCFGCEKGFFGEFLRTGRASNRGTGKFT